MATLLHPPRRASAGPTRRRHTVSLPRIPTHNPVYFFALLHPFYARIIASLRVCKRPCSPALTPCGRFSVSPAGAATPARNVQFGGSATAIPTQSPPTLLLLLVAGPRFTAAEPRSSCTVPSPPSTRMCAFQACFTRSIAILLPPCQSPRFVPRPHLSTQLRTLT